MKTPTLFTIDTDVKRRLDHWSNFNAGGYARPKRLNKSELIERIVTGKQSRGFHAYFS